MPPVYTLDRTALLKALLHSIKYPSASVNGILLADKKSNSQAVTVVDAIPVLHSFLTLAPVLETALIQVRVAALMAAAIHCFPSTQFHMQIAAYAKEQGLQIVGLYHANERFDDSELGQSARKIADKLYANSALACAILVRPTMHCQVQNG